jgi:hypothetical protein
LMFFFFAKTPLHGINSDSTKNHQLIDEESTGRMGFPPGITSSGMRNPHKEGDSSVITNSWKLIQTGKIKMCKKIFKKVTISGSATTTLM